MKDVTRFGWLVHAQSQHRPMFRMTRLRKQLRPHPLPGHALHRPYPTPHPDGGPTAATFVLHVPVHHTNPADRTRVARLTKAENGIADSSP